MLEGLMSLARILIFDLISIISLVAVALAVLIPIFAAVELINLIRTARRTSLRVLALRSRERIAALRFRLPRHGLRLVIAKGIAKATPESSKVA